MSTKIVNFVFCDRPGCQNYARCPSVTDKPAGWWQLIQKSASGKTLDICPPCADEIEDGRVTPNGEVETGDGRAEDQAAP